MEKLETYQAAILDILKEHQAYLPANLSEPENQLIADTVNHHYVLMSLGWEGTLFHYGPVMHFDIKGDKIWLQANNTDVDVGEELKLRGGPASDIMLGFYAAVYRPYTGYGVG